jgi:parallel beta-helix repeat protein
MTNNRFVLYLSKIPVVSFTHHKARFLGCFSLLLALLAGCNNSKQSTFNEESQTITFGAITSQTAGTTLSLSATATSGLPVSFVSTTSLVCTVSGTTATLIAAGECTVQATQAGNSTYAAATPVSQSFIVGSGSSYYVSPNGSDSADGSVAAPFLTLARAQQAMQQSTMIKTTQIFPGTYYLSGTLALNASDNGETWKPVDGQTEPVVISGGVVITGWTSQGNGIYRASAAQPIGLDLTVAGVRQMPADLGYNPDLPYISGWRIVDPNMANTTGNTITVQPSDLTASVKPGATVQVIDNVRWSDYFTTVDSVDAATHTVTLHDGDSTGTGIEGGNIAGNTTGSWRVLADPADLSAPGQFAYDKSSGKVYLMPASPDTLNTDSVVAAQLHTLISLSNASNITVSGLTFSDTLSPADANGYSDSWTPSTSTLYASSVTNCTISGNTFLNAGNGIGFDSSSHNTITGNTFNQLGGSGILLSGTDHNSITNNTLTGLGKINAASMGFNAGGAVDTIDSNMIDGAGRWGINFSSGQSAITNNVIRNTSQQTNDTGAIYSWAGNYSGYDNYGMTISGNRIENVGGLMRDGSGNYLQWGWCQGVYLDDHVSGMTITKNVVESGCNDGIYISHGGQGNTADNNVVVLQPVAIYDRGSLGTSFASGSMNYNGITRIDLLPSFFPSGVAISTIVVQLSGTASENTSAQFSVVADGSVIGSGTATGTISDYIFKTALTPHTIHRIGIQLVNGANSGTATTSLQNLAMFVNNTAVDLTFNNSRTGNYAQDDDLVPTDFSITHNIVYLMGGGGSDLGVYLSNSSYLDPDPGTINYNVLYQNIAKASNALFGSQALDAASVLSDPLFTDPTVGDYTLQNNSPAFGVGFNTAGMPLAP